MIDTRSAGSPVIEVIGADANNLRHIDLVLPLNAVSVVTGVSGSGKSSLLAETLAAEGIRRTRTFLDVAQGELVRGHVGAFVGPLPPTILVGQRGFRPSVRTTVGTATGFLSVLRRLFMLASRPYSEQAQEHVPSPSPETYAQWLFTPLPRNRRNLGCAGPRSANGWRCRRRPPGLAWPHGGRPP